jgi:hypothetical protein
MASRALIALVLVTSCRGHLREATAAFRDKVAGCYEIRNGDWRSDTLLARFHNVSTLPPGLELRTSLLKDWDQDNDSLPFYEVNAPKQPGYAESPFVYWEQLRVGVDSIHVGVPIAFGGASLRLGLRGSALEGTLTTFTDAIPADGIASAQRAVVLDRVRCRNDD